MKTTLRISVYLFLSFFIFVSCDAPKKESVVEKQPVEVSTSTDDEVAEPDDHGYEMAMSAYQCPMKCEGDKTYEEEGACPMCKMDLKQIEPDENSDMSKEGSSD